MKTRFEAEPTDEPPVADLLVVTLVGHGDLIDMVVDVEDWVRLFPAVDLQGLLYQAAKAINNVADTLDVSGDPVGLRLATRDGEPAAGDDGGDHDKAS